MMAEGVVVGEGISSSRGIRCGGLKGWTIRRRSFAERITSSDRSVPVEEEVPEDVFDVGGK